MENDHKKEGNEEVYRLGTINTEQIDIPSNFLNLKNGNLNDIPTAGSFQIPDEFKNDVLLENAFKPLNDKIERESSKEKTEEGPNIFYKKQKTDLDSDNVKIEKVKFVIFDLNKPAELDKFNTLYNESLDDKSNILITYMDTKYSEKDGGWKVLVQYSILKFLNYKPYDR